MFEKTADKVKRLRARTFTAVILLMVVGLLAMSGLKAAVSDVDDGEYGWFINPFTLEIMQASQSSQASQVSSGGNSSPRSPTIEINTSARPWIRIPYRPSLRSPYRPPL